MNFRLNNIHRLVAALVIILTFSSCKKFQGDVTIPAYLHLDRIDVVPQRQNSPSNEAGFYSSLVDCVQLIAFFEGDDKETTLGVFQFPVTVPVLRHGEMKYLRVLPCVKQNGSSTTRIAYPYYQTIVLENVKLAPDSVTNLGMQDEQTGEWYLEANYFERGQFTVLAEDYFEPTSFSSNLDSNVVWITNDREGACTGTGYGMVTVPDSVKVMAFYYNEEFNLPNSILYLEMDYWTDLELDLDMIGFPYSTAGTATSFGVMRLVPNNHWQKIYINLGRTWSRFNFSSPIKLFFQAINPNGTGGHVKIDNIKVVAI
ncbi:MAG: hypothetical protein KBT28_10390 [Bacteroidales bacterium]|nr:hypothetical protein [Candidatus Colimorpha merdihippi]